jgi:hypothetical protein
MNPNLITENSPTKITFTDGKMNMRGAMQMNKNSAWPQSIDFKIDMKILTKEAGAIDLPMTIKITRL